MYVEQPRKTGTRFVASRWLRHGLHDLASIKPMIHTIHRKHSVEDAVSLVASQISNYIHIYVCIHVYLHLHLYLHLYIHVELPLWSEMFGGCLEEEGEIASEVSALLKDEDSTVAGWQRRVFLECQWLVIMSCAQSTMGYFGVVA